MKNVTRKQEKNLRANLQFLGSLNDAQRKYTLSLMYRGIYTVDPEKIKELTSITPP
jgi:hypothetical protein